ncbi:MAG: hypothetical protein ACXW0F_06505 [Gaiellaceae bacterium]
MRTDERSLTQRTTVRVAAPRTSVLILGYGAFGRAVHAAVGNRADVSVSVYSRSPKHFDRPVANVIAEAESVHTAAYDVVVVALPGYAVRDVLGRCVHGTQATAFLSCVKGMDPESGRFPSDVINGATGSDYIAVMSGASFAHEMLVGRPVFLTLACVNPLLGSDLVQRLENDVLRLELTDDVRGLEIAGVGKNIVAIGAGIADGLDLGDNFRAAFVARGIDELRHAADRLGGRADTVVASGALADFILSCSSPRSRNYEHGWNLARGGSIGSALVEGRESVQSFVQLLHAQHIESHYFDSIAMALADPASIATALETRQRFE